MTILPYSHQSESSLFSVRFVYCSVLQSELRYENLFYINSEFHLVPSFAVSFGIVWFWNCTFVAMKSHCLSVLISVNCCQVFCREFAG